MLLIRSGSISIQSSSTHAVDQIDWHSLKSGPTIVSMDHPSEDLFNMIIYHDHISMNHAIRLHPKAKTAVVNGKFLEIMIDD